MKGDAQKKNTNAEAVENSRLPIEFGTSFRGVANAQRKNIVPPPTMARYIIIIMYY